MPYTDGKGRPELVVNPAIKLGIAFFTPVTPADDTAPAASTPRAAALPGKRPTRRRPVAGTTVSAGNAAPPQAPRRTARKRPAGDSTEAAVDRSTASGDTLPPAAPKQPTKGEGEASAPRRRPRKRKAGDTPTG